MNKNTDMGAKTIAFQEEDVRPLPECDFRLCTNTSNLKYCIDCFVHHCSECINWHKALSVVFARFLNIPSDENEYVCIHCFMDIMDNELRGGEKYVSSDTDGSI